MGSHRHSSQQAVENAVWVRTVVKIGESKMVCSVEILIGAVVGTFDDLVSVVIRYATVRG